VWSIRTATTTPTREIPSSRPNWRTTPRGVLGLDESPRHRHSDPEAPTGGGRALPAPVLADHYGIPVDGSHYGSGGLIAIFRVTSPVTAA